MSILRLHPHLQPDTGAVCAYWVAALASALQPKSKSDEAGRLAAARHLVRFITFYTGHAVPKCVRSRFVNDVHKAFNKCLDDEVMTSSLGEAVQALLMLLRSDDVLAPGAVSHRMVPCDGVVRSLVCCLAYHLMAWSLPRFKSRMVGCTRATSHLDSSQILHTCWQACL